MIAIILKWHVKPQYADQFPQLVSEFTQACRAEPGCLWFEWARSVDDPNEFVLLEAFTDEGAAPHVESDHFTAMQGEFPQYLQSTPLIISKQIESDGWAPMGEITVE